MPKQLCTPQVFRSKIAGNDGAHESLIKENPNTHGIPQGAPLSDLLANAYLLDFDVAVSSYAAARGDRYWRCSDDLAIVLPGGGGIGQEMEEWVSKQIETFGEAIQIKQSKTSIGEFTASTDEKHDYVHIAG